MTENEREEEPTTHTRGPADRPAVTLQQFMAAHRITGCEGVDDDGAFSLPAGEAGEKGYSRYTVGEAVARGGMGIILRAKDLSIRRTVAMKVMLSEKSPSRERVLRFIEEARVTGQLQHPGIVPVYEFSVNAHGGLFYTMKFVQGETLKDILEHIRQGDRETIDKYSLSQLLNLFLKVCDAVAFAHAKGVVHRDLKPENIMTGDYGEVLVLDWGLAKVLGHGPDRTGAKRADDDLEHVPAGPMDIDSLRWDEDAESLLTMDGQIMGTPRFMAPEQVRGKADAIDSRTDIYALGAILYNILTLRPPIKGDTRATILRNVREGRIVVPSSYDHTTVVRNESSADLADADTLVATPTGADGAAAGPGQDRQKPKRQGLPHCPNGRIPVSLSAVAMKALALKHDRRYSTVQELQKEVEAYQGGFVTRAEEASLVKQLLLLVKRHRREFSLAAAALFALTIAVFWFVVKIKQERDRAEGHSRDAQRNARQAEIARREADRSAEEATREADRARNAELTAKQQEQIARRNELDARRHTYTARMSQAMNAWEAGHMGVVRDILLKQSPEPEQPDLRCFAWQFLWGLCHGRTGVLTGHYGQIQSVAYSADGRMCATASEDGTARIWDVDTCKVKHVLRGHRAKIHTVRFCREGRLVATGSCDRTVRLWEAATGKQIRALSGHTGCVRGIAFSPDNTELATASSLSGKMGELILWEVSTGRRKSSGTGTWRASQRHPWGPSSLSYSPDGKSILAGLYNGGFAISEAASARELFFKKSAHLAWIRSVAFTPNGASFATGGDDGLVKLWDTGTRAELRTLLGHRGVVYSLCYDPTGTFLAAGTQNGVVLWDLASGETRGVGFSQMVNALSFSPDGGRLLASVTNRTAEIWDLTLGRSKTALVPSEKGTINCVAFAPDDARLASGDWRGNAVIWDLATNKELLRWKAHSKVVTDIAFSADGTKVATTTGKGTSEAKVWNAADGKLLFAVKGYMSLCFSADGKLLLTGSVDRTVKAWNAETGALAFSLRGHKDKHVRSLTLSPNGKMLASADGKIKLWDLATRTETASFDIKGHLPELRFSPAGDLLAYTTQSNNVQLWDVGAKNPVDELRGHTGKVVAIAFSPDGRTLASGGNDMTVKLWNVATREEMLTLPEPREVVRDLAFSHDGSVLASVGGNMNSATSAPGEAFLWRIADQAEVEDAIRQYRIQRNLTKRQKWAAKLERQAGEHAANREFESLGESARELTNVWAEIVRDHPDRVDCRLHQGNCADRLAWVFRRSEQLEQAGEFFRTAVQSKRQLVTDYPGNPDYRCYLGASLHNSAMLDRDQQDLQTARDLIYQAIEHQRVALTTIPWRARYRRFLRNHYGCLGGILIELRDDSGAAKTAAGLGKLYPRDPNVLYTGAVTYAQCAAVAERKPGLGEEQRNELRDSYLAESIKRLNTAVTNGFSDTGKLRSDPKLAPLRKTDKFRAIVRQLEANKTP